MLHLGFFILIEEAVNVKGKKKKWTKSLNSFHRGRDDPGQNHCLGEEVFAGVVRERMNGVGWPGWTSDPGHQGFGLDGLTEHWTTLDTALLWFLLVHSHEPRAESRHLCFLVLVWALPWVLYPPAFARLQGNQWLSASFCQQSVQGQCLQDKTTG